MNDLFASTLLVATGLLLSVPAFAQNAPGEGPTMVGPGSGAYNQKPQNTNLAGKRITDGSSPTMVGPASSAHQQKTDGERPTAVGLGGGGNRAQ
jgi:hypothetical protein